MLSTREQKILQILYNSKKYVTIEKISELISYSPQTVRNDIKKIKNYINCNSLGNFITKPHIGVAFFTSKEKWDKLQSIQKDEMSLNTSAGFRKWLICKILLSRQLTSIANLSKKLYLSKSGIKKALGEAEAWLSYRNIKLKKISGKGFCISCSELSRRIAFMELFSEMPEEANAASLPVGKLAAKSDLANEISVFFGGFNAIGVIDTIHKAEDYFGIRFSYNSKKQLVFCLSLMIYECKSKSVLQENYPENKFLFNRAIANLLSRDLQRIYDIALPEQEIDYITFCVSISEINSFSNMQSFSRCKEYEKPFCCTINKLISLISDIIGINFRSDKTLFINLFLYLRSAIVRCKYGVHSVNSLCSKIKAEYPNIYTAAWTAGILLEDEMKVEISGNEVGMLTLYIVEAIGRANSNIKICILCNYGIGISQLLKQKIERYIPNISVADTVTTQDTEKIQNSCCDFIVTTQNIGSSFNGKDVVIVDNLLLPYDIEQIKQEMLKIRIQKLNKIAQPENALKINLFNSNFVYIIDDSVLPEKEDLIKNMCMQLEKNGYVLKGFLDSVLKRERSSSTGIGRHIAIPHGYTKFVIRPIISVALLKRPIEWDNRESVDLVFLLALKKDDTFHTRDQMMRFYSVLATLLDDDKCLQYTKNICDKEKFAAFMNKLTKRDEC